VGQSRATPPWYFTVFRNAPQYPEPWDRGLTFYENEFLGYRYLTDGFRHFMRLQALLQHRWFFFIGCGGL
jgi:hypothetical protein